MLISLIVSARADVLDAAPILGELRERQPGWTIRLVYAGAGGEDCASIALMQELSVSPPDAYLGVHRGTCLAETTGTMRALQNELESARPDALMVFGDTAAALAGALAAAQLAIPVAHVQAGLRSFNRRAPDEINRVLADAVSQWLFTTERHAGANLRAEGLPERQIQFVGSTAIDMLIRHRAQCIRTNAAAALGLDSPYVVIALSKAHNVDDGRQLRAIAYALLTLADEFDVVCSLTPHVAGRFDEFQLADTLGSHPRLHLLPANGYIAFISLLNDAAAVLTDSGAVQGEALVIGTPCTTLCHYTKHQVTVAHGGNRLAGGDPHLAVRYVREAITSRAGYAPIPERWDGHAAKRIVDVMERDLAAPP